MRLSYFALPVFSYVFVLSSASPVSSNHESRSNPFLIHQFRDPTWVENLAVRSNGQILSTLVTSADLYLLHHLKNPNSSATLIHNFPSYHALLGITETSKDVFHLIASNFTLPNTIASGTSSVWTVDLTEYDARTNTGAKIHEVGPLADAGLLNGLSTLDAEKGLIVAADSVLGALFVIDVNYGAYELLIEGPDFQNLGEGTGLGVNGVRVLPNNQTENEVWVYFTNTARSTFSRVLVSTSTLVNTSAIETLATGIAADDFALDTETGFAYLGDGLESDVFSVPLTGGKIVSVTNPNGCSNPNTIFQPTSVQIARGLGAKKDESWGARSAY